MLRLHKIGITPCLLAIALVVVMAALACRPAVEPELQPNVIVIMIDDLGYGDVGCYGATAVETPHIDRLAAEGLRFTSGYAPAAICTPTRFAFLTGKYASEINCNDNGLATTAKSMSNKIILIFSVHCLVLKRNI